MSSGVKFIQKKLPLPINSLPFKLSYLIFNPLNVVFPYQDPQLKVGENYSYLGPKNVIPHCVSVCHLEINCIARKSFCVNSFYTFKCT